MKIVAFSDIHGDNIRNMPSADVFICAGDFSAHGSIADLVQFNTRLDKLQGRKIVVAGNHDWVCERNYSLAKSCFSPDVHFLQDEAIHIEGFLFYGTPWQPLFLNWAFNLPEEQLKEKFAKIPDSVDVLITHCPPYGILDVVDGYHQGSPSLMERVMQIKPKYHIFGHIHEGYGKYEENGTTFLNVSVLDGDYRMVREPVSFEV